MTLLQSLHCKAAEVPGCWITVFARFSPEAPPLVPAHVSGKIILEELWIRI